MAKKNKIFTEPFDFYPCDSPHGMEYYDMTCLTKMQQQRLNIHKVEVIRENQKFLHKNPEIRAIIQIIMRKILIERPTHDIERFIGRYVCGEWESIVEEVNEYVKALPGKPLPVEHSIKTRKSVVVVERASKVSTSSTSMRDNETVQLIKDMLDDMLANVTDLYEQQQTSDDVEIIDEERQVDRDDQVMMEMGLDFDLDFSAYHEEEFN